MINFFSKYNLSPTKFWMAGDREFQNAVGIPNFLRIMGYSRPNADLPALRYN